MAALRVNVGGVRHVDLGPGTAALGRSYSHAIPPGTLQVPDMDAAGAGPVERRTLTSDEAAARGFTIGAVDRAPARPLMPPIAGPQAELARLRGAAATRARHATGHLYLPQHSDAAVLAAIRACGTAAAAALQLGCSESSISRRLGVMRKAGVL